ncbi:hypothetical protein PLESTB_000590500 [Pleodorina starrii]|uniref:Ankyrin repeat domain-containing protein n=1 Tax=Pleodorina starrii TaxID=330485 RepID=A0A9W6F0Y6_9CHLO|nr:hypothetical protein PLESTM_000763700 [Pleodorina starrii]GLC52169.1 hypothetical protein PLESTB_000590500 [Pleodorina starrii]
MDQRSTADQEVAPSAEDDVGSRVWLPGVVAHISSFMSTNDIACTLRLINKATSKQFESYRTVRLSLSSPAHAFKRRWGSPNAFRGLSRLQRQKLLCLTAASGSIANLEIALDNAGLVASSELLNAAAAAGQLEACKLLRERGCTWGDGLLASAARAGHRHVCEWLLASGCPFDASAAAEAARGGHESLIYWLMERQLRHLPVGGASDAVRVVAELLSAAAEGLNLPALQRLHQQLLAGHQHKQQQQPGQGQDGEEEEEDEVQSAAVLDAHQKARVLGAAAGSPTPDWQAKVKWLEGLGYPHTEHAVRSGASFASRNNEGDDDDSIGRLQWLCDRGYPVCPAAVDDTVACGNLAGLQFLMQQQQPEMKPSDGADILAAIFGRLAVLQFIHARGWPLRARAVAHRAAGEGHLHVVVWAVETLGVTPDNARDLFDAVAGSGSMEMLIWLRERGWTCGCDTVPYAVRSGCEEALEWLVLEQGCPLPANGELYDLAARDSDLAVLRCLHRLGCPWGPNQVV